MSLVQNERTKLTATYLNGVAIAIFAVGGLAPVVSWLNSGSGSATRMGALALICILVSGGIHLVAPYLLKGLQS